MINVKKFENRIIKFNGFVSRTVTELGTSPEARFNRLISAGFTDSFPSESMRIKFTILDSKLFTFIIYGNISGKVFLTSLYVKPL